MADISPFVSSASTRIARRASAHAAEVDRAADPERDLVDAFTTRVEEILADYDPPSTRREAGGLVFEHLYAAARRPLRDEEGWRVPSSVFMALLAAEVEFRGPVRLSAIQHTLLAEVYERLGGQLTRFALPAHAALAFRRAAALYRLGEDVDAEDRCGLELAKARTRSHPPGWRRWTGRLSYISCGYGYRPFWLLGWVAVQLILFITFGFALSGNGSHTQALFISVTSFLNPPGFGDIENLPRASRWLYAIEPWAGVVSMSVFFALLVRKWFRL
ncbi:hypothetical protein ACFYTQ_02450 [Nocardia sp. NPDC004068]|uniref:hypothetical protein n=1 Tax=Nocardia sp. NPDC004068 TaxID=3364303 RepID=UPI0036915998